MNEEASHTSYPIKIPLHRKHAIFYASLCILAKPFEILEHDAADFLHPEEYVYFSTLQHRARKYSYLIGRYCAKQALSIEPFALKPSKYAITTGIFGQPIVSAAKNIQVSIAHSITFGAALAFPEEHPMGIDIEPINDKNLDAKLMQMTPEELALMAKYHQQTPAATLLWTAKEALSKIMRTGFMTPFSLFEISSCKIEGNFIYTYFKNFNQYQACSFLVNDHICSIVYPKQTKMLLD